MSTVVRTDALESLEATRPVIERISDEVWNFAELSLEEVRSAEVHARELEAAGFTVETGTSGFGTAFVAERRFGDGPVVGLLSEYDALPGLGNEAVPRQQPRAGGNSNGHGCGHNLLGAALTGSAIAAASVLEAHDLSGTVRVYGCAAEEAEGAKVYMARDGLFVDVDACLHWHPWSFAAVMNMRLAAANAIRIAFHGKTGRTRAWSRGVGAALSTGSSSRLTA